MKQEYPTYLKTIGKSKALVATLSDTEPKFKSNDSNDKGILSAFTTIVDPTEEVTETKDEEEDLVSLRKWMNKMTSIQPMQNCTRFLRSMRNCIGWPPRS